MKTFTRIYILVLVMLVSSAVVYAQNSALKSTLSDVELQMMQQAQPVSNFGVGAPTDFLATPITSFPYIQNFESGWPAQMDDVSGTYAEAYTASTYAYSGNSLFLTAISLTGWGSTPYTYAAAFDPVLKWQHFGTASMDVVPDGSGGVLMMEYMMRQGYSFNSNYSWYRVLVNGAVIFEMGGAYYWQPSTLTDPYLPYEFDLSGFAGAPFTIELQSSCKYNVDYYNLGDWTGIDDLKIYYKQDPGDLEGYVMNGGGLSINGATVGIDGWGIVTSDPSGYYFMSTVPGGNNTVWGWKAGYNVVTYDAVNVPPLGLGYQDIILTSPTMFVTPTFHEYTLNPEEYFTTQTGITNTGDGPLEWTAAVVYPITDGVSQAVSIPAFTGQIQQGAAPSLREAPKNPNGTVGELYVIDGPLAGGIGFIGEPATDNLYSMDFDAGYATTLIGGSAVDPASGDMLNGDFDNMYVATAWGASLSVVDVNTGAVTLIGNFSGAPSDVSGMACDRTTGTMYVGTTDVTTSYIGVLDVATGAITDVFETPGIPGLIDIAIDGAGQMYGWGIVNDASYLIDKATGATTLLGSLGQDLNYGQGGNYNINDGIIYMTAYAGGGAGLYVLDPITGAMASVGGLPASQCTALGIPGSGGGGAGDWLTLDYYTGTNAGSGFIENVPTNFDASGTSPGEIYHADLVFTSNPDVGTSTIPCTMIIAGDPLVPPSNLVVTLDDDINGVVKLTWDWTTDAFQFFVIKRDGILVGSAYTTTYYDNIPDYGTYCYTVQGYYDEGYTTPAGPECIEWALPEIYINPDFKEAWVWTDATYQWETTITNTGIGSLVYLFPDYVTDAFDCQHEVVLYDDYGDGWNGGALNVYVDGTLVVSGATIASGAGPDTYYFIAELGDEITTTYTAGSWSYENWYEIVDGYGNVIATDGAGGVTPSGIGPGVCFADCPVPSFIVDVSPATGIIPEGGHNDIEITWDATGFTAGDYYEDLLCESNDPITPVVNIGNLMHVYTPGQFAGTVTDCESGMGIPSVTVTVGIWQTISDNNGDYSLYVDPGTYVVYFDKLGYESLNVPNMVATAGLITSLDVMLCEAPYPVPWVTATVNYPDEDYCTVDWGFPIGPYEIYYDDGSAEDLFVWSAALSENAVRFTPAGYPASVIGGRVYVGDGLWPVGSWLNSEFAMLVYDDDGTDGAPGTILDSIPVVVTNYGWLEFYSLTPANLDDGEFYLSMLQLTNAPNAAPIGIDLESPTAYRSWSKMSTTGWSLSVYQDFMIRAYVDGPQTDMIAEEGKTVFPPKVNLEEASKHFSTANGSGFVTVPGTVKSGALQNIEGFENATEDISYYVVARMSDFDPLLGPETGTMTVLNNTTALTYQDDAFSTLPMGWYAYAVKVVYSSTYESIWVYSLPVGRDMDVAVTFEVTLCDGGDPEDVEISMRGEDFPFTPYFGVTDVTGIYTFDQVWKGPYEIEVSKIGYETYYDNQTFMSDQTIEVVLSEKRYPPRNLWVDPLTSFAYWEPPIVVALDETFEGAFMPPTGWQMTTNSVGWFLTTDGSSAAWTVPAWNSQYACANDDAAGSSADGSVDYLITPALDLREVDTYRMMFDSYYDGAFGQLATVEYSYDAGATWEIFYALTPMAGSWNYIDIDLATFSGLTATDEVWFAFHSDDGGQYASGWAIDNVFIANGEVVPNGYHVYLDGAFTIATDTTFYQYQYLTYGVTYIASVAAVYSCGLSEQIYYTWTSEFLAPPNNLDGYAQDDAAFLWWEPPLIPATDALDYAVLSEEPRKATPSMEADYSPTVRVIEKSDNEGTKAFMDLQFSYTGQATGSNGIEFDGTNFYTTNWNPGPPNFIKYDIDGNLLYEFDIAGVDQVRDLAFDGTYMYGAAANTTVFIMDMTTETLIGTVTAPLAVRAIAYDPVNDGFYGNNWSDDITLFDRATGAFISSFPCGVFISYYGFAYDGWSDGGPYLWGFSQAGGGAELVQMHLPDGAEVYNVDAHSIVGGTEVGGGLFTDCGSFVDGKATLGGIIQSDAIIFGLELADCSGGGGGGGGVPDNLLGYNLYRDMNDIVYIPYNGEDTTDYWDLDLLPLCYDYDVTALYDLTPYGFPGDIGESMYEGTKELCVEYGWPLPFVEEWTTGSFDPNLWTSGENWVVNGQIGNPEPSSEFKWDPILTDYRSSLTSYAIDGKYHPNTEDQYIDGRIWFDFDIKLNDVNATGLEMLQVEIWNNGTWYSLMSFDNSDGSFDWSSNHLDVSDRAFGEIFRVRFTADGVMSSDILSWFIDNVNIYRQCDAPMNLFADVTDLPPNEILLKWSPPYGGGGPVAGEWIHWDDGVNVGNAIGFGGAAVWSVASHMEPTSLTTFDGMYITKIRFFAGLNSGASTFTLKVWEGTDGLTMIYEEAVPTVLLGDWNEVVLAAPVAIDITTDLWFGYTTEQFTADDYPAGCDAGPAVTGYGDMLNAGTGWESMNTSYGLDYNWNLQAYVAEVTDGSPSIPMIDYTILSTPDDVPQIDVSAASGSVNMADNSARDLTGYNVYWSDNGADYEYLDFTEDTMYLHVSTDPFAMNSLQCYYVTAVFEDCEPASNEACVIVTGIEAPELSDDISVFPNPARELLNVTSSSDISHVTIMNYVGQVVYNQKVVEDNDLQVNVAGFETGVYMVKVETSAGIVVKKVTIAH